MVVFHNVVIFVLFNYIHRNSILHIVVNKYARLTTSWSRWSIYLVVEMVNILSCRDDQYTKYVTLTTSTEKVKKTW
jgi:hypothetical protein